MIRECDRRIERGAVRKRRRSETRRWPRRLPARRRRAELLEAKTRRARKRSDWARTVTWTARRLSTSIETLKKRYAEVKKKLESLYQYD